MSSSPEELRFLDTVFPVTNLVGLGYVALVFAPRWKHTASLALGLALFYSALYAFALLHRLGLAAAAAAAAAAASSSSSSPSSLLLSSSLLAAEGLPSTAHALPAGSGFGTLAGVVALFGDREVAFAGWLHYVAFDLLVARYIVQDARAVGLPHWAAAWTVPVTMMAGPAGFLCYNATKYMWLHTAGRPGGGGGNDKLPPCTVAAAARSGSLSLSLAKGKRWVAGRSLVFLYLATCGLSLFMVIWILVAPSSWLVGNSATHDRLLHAAFSAQPTPLNPASRNRRFVVNEMVVPTVVTKYAGHRLVQFTHTLPGALWAGLVPFQLRQYGTPQAPRSRAAAAAAAGGPTSSTGRRHHRSGGYAFFACAGLMLFGLVVIEARGLAYYAADFPQLPVHEAASELLPAAWLDPASPSFGPGGAFSRPAVSLPFVLRVAALWFGATAAASVRHATRKRFAAHRAWALRHVGAGLWVAIQRLLLPVLHALRPSCPDHAGSGGGGGGGEPASRGRLQLGRRLGGLFVGHIGGSGAGGGAGGEGPTEVERGECVARRQKAIFGDAALLGLALALTAAEVAVWALRVREEQRKGKKAKAERVVGDIDE